MKIFLLLLMCSFHLSGYDFEHPKYELIQKVLIEEHNFSAEEIKLDFFCTKIMFFNQNFLNEFIFRMFKIIS